MNKLDKIDFEDFLNSKNNEKLESDNNNLIYIYSWEPTTAKRRHAHFVLEK